MYDAPAETVPALCDLCERADAEHGIHCAPCARQCALDNGDVLGALAVCADHGLCRVCGAEEHARGMCAACWAQHAAAQVETVRRLRAELASRKSAVTLRRERRDRVEAARYAAVTAAYRAAVLSPPRSTPLVPAICAVRAEVLPPAPGLPTQARCYVVTSPDASAPTAATVRPGVRGAA